MNLVEKRNYKRGDNKKAKMLKKACVGIESHASFDWMSKTPEESAVVSKAGGLSENVIAKPLRRERQEKTIFRHIGRWRNSETKIGCC